MLGSILIKVYLLRIRLEFIKKIQSYGNPNIHHNFLYNMAQRLIDADISNLFINGTDEDRAVLTKVYPEINFEVMKDQLMFSLFRDHQKNPRKVYPCNYKGRIVSFCIMTIEDEQN